MRIAIRKCVMTVKVLEDFLVDKEKCIFDWKRRYGGTLGGSL